MPLFSFLLIIAATRHADRLLEHLYDWSSPSDATSQADLIFALAGRQSRKFYALELFQRPQALLLSVARFEIRKFAQLPWPADIDLLQLASGTPPAPRHYFVSFEVGTTRVEWIRPGYFGTLSEIRAPVRSTNVLPDFLLEG